MGIGSGLDSKWGTMRTKRWATAFASAGLIAGGLLVSDSAGAGREVSTLPSGVPISVSIDSPADGTTYVLPAGQTTVPVPVTGTASVGKIRRDTTLVIVADTSLSMRGPTGTDCTTPDSRIRCLKKRIRQINGFLASDFSRVKKVGLVSFDAPRDEVRYDVNSAVPGRQVLVNPASSGNALNAAANSMRLGGGGTTNYHSGLRGAIRTLNSPGNNSEQNVIAFVSDGRDNTPPAFSRLADRVPPNTSILTFAFGQTDRDPPIRCVTNAAQGRSLRQLSRLSTLGSGRCVDDRTTERFLEELSELVEDGIPTLDAVGISVNGGPSSPADTTGIPLPEFGPVTTGWTENLNLGLGEHEICATAFGTDRDGKGDVTTCITVFVIDADIVVEKTASNGDCATTDSGGTDGCCPSNPAADGGTPPTCDVWFDVTVRNDGPADTQQVVGSDVLPPEVTFQEAQASQGTYDPTTGTWDIGALAVGESATLLIKTTAEIPSLQASSSTVPSSSVPPPCLEITNTAEAFSEVSDPNLANNVAEASLEVCAPK